MNPKTKNRLAHTAFAAAIIAILTGLSSCTGCIGIVDWGDPGEGRLIEFAEPAPLEVTP